MKFGNVWKHGNLDTLMVIRDVVFTGTRWVASGDDGKVFVSTEGETWSLRPTGQHPTDHLMGVAYGNGVMVAVGRDRLIISSLDQGDNWTTANPRAKDKPQEEDFYKVAFGNNMFLTVSEGGNIWKSTDGVNWKASASLIVGGRYIAFGNGWFMVATVPGKIFRSQDGVTWTPAELGGNIKAVHYGNSLWLAAGNKIWTSDNNGVSWTTRLDLPAYDIKCHLYCVTSAPGTYIAAGEGGLVFNSDDGISWRKPKQFTRGYILGMAYGNSLLAAVGTGSPRNPQELFKYSTHYSLEGGTPPDPFPPDHLPPVTIKIVSPNGGEHLTGGTSFDIKWKSSKTFDKVDIEYNNGSEWVVIENGIKDKGSYSWSVPNNVSTTKAKIWIKGWSFNGNPVDFSDNTFTITPPASITITSPNGGEVLAKGFTVNITWNSSGEVGNINVSYSTNSGLNWTTIASSTPNHGTLAWKVPDIISDKCLVKVSDESDPRVFDMSNNVFSIKEATQDQLPFGVIDTPEDGLTGVSGSIAVTGWALDDAGVESVKIYRKVTSGLYYIGDATFQEGARPDVEKIYPGYPNITRAGWGYMLQTNLFPDGKLDLKAIAADSTGNLAELGTKTIFLENEKKKVTRKK